MFTSKTDQNFTALFDDINKMSDTEKSCIYIYIIINI